MIVDHVSQIARYAKLGKHFPAAVDFIRNCNPETLPEGVFQIDGSHVYGLVKTSTYDKPPATWEAHRKYCDIQLVIEGNEVFGYCPLAGVDEEAVYNETKDAALFAGLTGINIELSPQQFVIFLPHEFHLPGGIGRSGGSCRKLILKVEAD